MSWDTMKVFITAVGAIVTALILPAAAQSLSKDIAGRIEAIPIQTLTISDEQFLKGDAYGKPTTIAGALRVAFYKSGQERLSTQLLCVKFDDFTGATCKAMY